MREQQATFGFDIFEMGGFTAAAPKIEDQYAEANRRLAEERARAKREREQERTRRAYEAKQREKAERDEREREEFRRERNRQQFRTSYSSPWDTLGVKFGATKAEARAAWVRLCRQHHPDAGGDVETMKRVNNAWNQIKGQAR